jgi:hypothetical protein
MSKKGFRMLLRALLMISAVLSCFSAEAGEKFTWSSSYSVRSREGTVYQGSESLLGKGAEASKARKMAPLAAERLTRNYVYSLDHAGGHHPEPIVIERVVPRYIPTLVPVYSPRYPYYGPLYPPYYP